MIVFQRFKFVETKYYIYNFDESWYGEFGSLRSNNSDSDDSNSDNEVVRVGVVWVWVGGDSSIFRRI